MVFLSLVKNEHPEHSARWKSLVTSHAAYRDLHKLQIAVGKIEVVHKNAAERALNILSRLLSNFEIWSTHLISACFPFVFTQPRSSGLYGITVHVIISSVSESAARGVSDRTGSQTCIDQGSSKYSACESRVRHRKYTAVKAYRCIQSCNDPLMLPWTKSLPYLYSIYCSIKFPIFCGVQSSAIILFVRLVWILSCDMRFLKQGPNAYENHLYICVHRYHKANDMYLTLRRDGSAQLCAWVSQGFDQHHLLYLQYP